MALLGRADVVVGYAPYIELIAGVLAPDVQVESSGMRQEVDRCRHALALHREGKRVVVVSSGDAGVYGMAGLLMELDPSADVEVAPGITACQAAAARLGAPLMNDFAVLSLSDLLTPREGSSRGVGGSLRLSTAKSFMRGSPAAPRRLGRRLSTSAEGSSSH